LALPKKRRAARSGLAESAKAGRVALLTPEFLEDWRWWIETSRATALRVCEMIDAITRDPFHGIGKPELLKHLGPDVWSRRLTDEHRIVYHVAADRISFLQGRYHY
jgi:toxin YoeB